MMMQHVANGRLRVLALAPHTDDVELGCGGTIARLLQNGAEVFVASFSTAEESLPTGAPPTMLRDEFLCAMGSLGIPDACLTVYRYPVRRFSCHRQEILEDLVKLRRRIAPDVVFLPSATDLHQDHQILYAEGVRTFKDLTVWGYELPWNNINFPAQAFVSLDPCHLEAKWKALESYNSQIQLARPYFCRNFIEGLARVRGAQVKVEFAEAFEVERIRW